MTCRWDLNKAFLFMQYQVKREGMDDLGVTVRVGWDGAAGRIRSWTFDSEGGFAEATWTKQGDQWFISNTGVLADGQKITMVNVMKPVDESSFTWQTVERTVGGELLPNIDEVMIVRE